MKIRDEASYLLEIGAGEPAGRGDKWNTEMPELPTQTRGSHMKRLGKTAQEHFPIRNMAGDQPQLSKRVFMLVVNSLQSLECLGEAINKA
jgi:hypothetical protein